MEKQPKLLVIDDDPDILKVVAANLRLYGFKAETAETWTHAREILGVLIPDLILLDLTLPDGDGIGICKVLKEQYPRVPVIMLTARDSVSDKVIGLESGADDYIVKPFETLELVARVKACLRRMNPVARRIAVDELEIFPDERTVRLGGEGVELTPKEYDLLLLLVMQRGEVITRDYIRKKLWGDSKLYSWSRVIDVHVQHLRQKIERDPSSPEYVLTVSGAGYKFKP
jgi:DNA-binding response OmpR family regulator